MKKNKGKTFKPRNEFRYNYSQNHKNFVFGERGNKFQSVGITHEEYTFGKKNMPLSRNPQKGKTEPSFIRNGIISDKKKNYGRPLKNYSFSNKDYKNVKSKIRNYKKRHKKGK